MLKVELLSKKTIKPSTPTPPHLRTFNLSLLDQLFPAYWVHVILFYHGGDRSLNPAGRLKRSLSETLTHHYPIAGRIRESSPGGKIYVECNDEGVEFSESVIDCDIDSVLSNPPIEEFVHLIPVKHTYFSIDEPLLAVQLNRFKCGGWALGVCVSHRIADGISMSSLITSWATAATGGGGGDERLMFSHWCRFPLYEADFGWGRPTWLGQASYEFCNFVLFMEGRGADGMEAWVWLQEEELKRLRNDPELLSFTF
ncbi:Salutaridinol 7-O-acetyltransferase [Acorus gramineus]|uniref:Salutaridinol 7-O-acetyltransferase n=1 Tax=Acorus gramineus TaxID=55184 RepID=A0AAV9AAB2_ACOGR|nr:Salutaridinol 7-O-acetyltransferase [Acorus gramineus]